MLPSLLCHSSNSTNHNSRELGSLFQFDMKTSNTAGIPSNHGDDDDDDQKEFNGMDVEDWLVKQHELADRNQAREGSPRDAVIKSAGEVVRKQRTPREVVDSVGSLLVDDFQTKTVSPVSSRFAQHDLDLGNLNKPPPIPFSETSSDNMAISGLYEDQMTEKEVPPEEVIDASIRRIDGTDDYYIAELTVNSKRDGHMVVDGVRTTNPKIKKILQVSFALAVAIVIAVVAGKITTRFLQEPAPPEAIEIPSSSANDTCLGGTWAQNFSTTVGIRSNLNWTIAEAAIASDKAGFCPIALYMSPLLREILFDKFNRSDDNFTVFPISMYGVQLFDGLDVSILSKMITDPWVGHAVSQPPTVSSLLSRQNNMIYHHDFNSLIVYCELLTRWILWRVCSWRARSSLLTICTRVWC